MNEKALKLSDVELEAVYGGKSEESTQNLKLPCDYKVVAGDNLWNIAVKFYGKGYLYNKIYEANKAKIGDNCDLIRPGLVLHIPA